MKEQNISEIILDLLSSYPWAVVAISTVLAVAICWKLYQQQQKKQSIRKVHPKAPLPEKIAKEEDIQPKVAIEIKKVEELDLKSTIEDKDLQSQVVQTLSRPEPETLSPVSSLGEELKTLDESSWLSRLKDGLSKTRLSLQESLGGLFQKKISINESLLESIHETLYRCDIGVMTIDKLVDNLRKSFQPTQELSWPDVKQVLAIESERILNAAISTSASDECPKVILIVGVNGVGKTTTIGKLAAHYLSQNKSVLLCAADTYRAAAIDQLKVWGDRLGVKVISHQQGSDPAAVAYDAVAAAKARNIDVVLIDTAGRLHNKNHLMEELNKINKVISKDIPNAPHETFLVLDATTGQNAFMQVKAFKEVVKLSGLCVTKLDGTAKGGVVIGIVDQFKVPVKFIGVGEKAGDLRQFNAKDFVDSLF